MYKSKGLDTLKKQTNLQFNVEILLVFSYAQTSPKQSYSTKLRCKLREQLFCVGF